MDLTRRDVQFEKQLQKANKRKEELREKLRVAKQKLKSASMSNRIVKAAYALKRARLLRSRAELRGSGSDSEEEEMQGPNEQIN
eukprot:4063334-Pyramimonas_sp.AAC.1